MNKLFKKELILEGLGCANCAAKIEDKVNKLEDIASANLSFATKTLIIELEDQDKFNEVTEKIKDIVKRLEPDVVVKEKVKPTIRKAEANNKVISLNKYSHNHEYCDCDDHSHSDDEAIGHSKEGDNHGHSHGAESSKWEFVRLLIGVGFFTVPLVFELSSNLELILYVISYILVGGEIVLRSVKNISRGQVFDENFLMTVATIGAFAIREYPEAVAVMIFYQIGELFQDIAVNRSRKSIADLMDIRPDFANLKNGKEFIKVSPEEVSIGDIIMVKPGEKVPLDGIIIEGRTMVDTSALTGESLPRELTLKDEVLGGFINKSGLIYVEVKKSFGESTVSKILDLVQNAGAKKAPTEKFITKFARYYTPAVVFSALALAILPPLLINGATFSDWLYRALVFLVVSCPCALVVSIPLGFFGGIGAASKSGILIKGGNYLEALNNVETVVFDKTGTLTKGVFEVGEIKAETWITKEELLKYAAYAESYSNHPIATSILKAYGNNIDKALIGDYEEISGHGIKVKVEEKVILAGNHKLMKKENIEVNNTASVGSIVHIGIEGKYAGFIVISDNIKGDAREAISGLKKIGVKSTIMLTGDNRLVAEKVAAELSLDKVYSELLPQHKVEKLEEIDKNKSSKGKLIFVGDGINDAPVLARADIGIAMGGVGSDAAIEAADVVIMTDEPSKIVSAIRIAKSTRKIVWQNIIFALFIKLIILILGALGIASMWEAVFGDVGVALLAVLNSMRALRLSK